MPLSPTNITAAIFAAGPDLRGISWARFVPVLGSALAAWAQVPGNLVINGVTTGVAGAGSVFGTLAVPPNPIPVIGASASAGMLGVSAAGMARAVGVGVAASFSTTYVGVSAGVGAGTDISRVVIANGPALTAAITTAATAAGMGGVLIPQIAVGFGTGISILLLTATGIGVVTGPAGPIPGGGTSVSRIL